MSSLHEKEIIKSLKQNAHQDDEELFIFPRNVIENLMIKKKM